MTYCSVVKVSTDPDDDLYTVLDHGYVRFVDKVGDDKKIVRAARVSFDKGLKGDVQDYRLLQYLYTHGHSSPFEMCSITFEVRMPIFVARQIMRHRTFRFNEVSGRYTKLKDEFYIPHELRAPDNKNKQSSVPSDDLSDSICDVAYATRCAAHIYNKLLQSGVCKEQARMILPLNTYTTVWVNADLNNLLKFLSKRESTDAQWETRQYALAMKRILERHFPWTMSVYSESIKNGMG